MLREPSIPHRVARVRGVLTAVDFDDEAPLATCEIDDIRSDRLLANEFAAIDRARAQAIPELELNLRGISTKAPSPRGLY
jgi:hypothetical protein